MGLWLKDLSSRKNSLAFFLYKMSKLSGQITLKVAASGSFRITVSNKLIGYGPRRTLMGRSIINEYDISDLIKNDNPYIVVEIVYHGTDSFYIVNEQPFLFCEIYENDKLIATEKDFCAYLCPFKDQKVMRYSYQRNFLESYSLLANPNNIYYGDTSSLIKADTVEVSHNKLVSLDLPYPSFKELKFSLIEEGGVFKREQYSVINVGKSSACNESTILFDEKELDFDVIKEISKYYYDIKKDSADKFYTFSLDCNKTGFIKSTIKTMNDVTLFFVFDETINYENLLHHSIEKEEAEAIFEELYRNGTLPIHFSRMSTINIIKYSLKMGEYNLCSLEPYTLKYLRIIAVGSKIEIKDIGFILYENDDVYNKYEGIDERKQLVYDAALSTLAQNSVDILTDCPSRERGGWLCDSYFSSRAEYHLTHKNRVEKNFLSCFLDMDYRSDLPYGMLPMVYPSDNYTGKFIPNWVMFLFLEIEEYAKRNDDYDFALKFKEKAYNLYNYFNKFENEYNLLENLESWVFIEWSKSNEYTSGVNFPTNMLYSEFLMALSRLFSDNELKEKAIRIKNNINKLSFNGTFYEDNALRENGKLVLKGHITETCQYYAFYFNVATRKGNKELYDILFNKFPDEEERKKYDYVARSNMFIGDVLRIDYLYKNKEYEKAANECTSLFYPMAERTKTLWEYEDISASLNHAFASVAVEWLDKELSIKK